MQDQSTVALSSDIRLSPYVRLRVNDIPLGPEGLWALGFFVGNCDYDMSEFLCSEFEYAWFVSSTPSLCPWALGV